MSLLPFRLHSLTCPFHAQGRAYNRCKCPVWVDGSINRRRVLRSLKTRDWQKAQRVCRDMEESGNAAAQIDSKHPNVEECIALYRAELSARQITAKSLLGHNPVLNSLLRFCADKGIRDLRQFTLSLTEQYRQSWGAAVNGLSAIKYLGRLRGFFGYAVDHDWMETNFAKRLRNPKYKHPPTMPFSIEEMRQLLRACDEHQQPELKALLLLMRYSGLRIGDATALNINRIQGTRLFLYTAKSDTPVFCILPEFVVAALAGIKKRSAQYWFWDGNRGDRADESLDSLTNLWRKRLYKIAKLAGVPNPNPHRFRDTYAVALLNSDVPIRRLSVLLGHSSIAVTERHYAPWVKESQRQLEADQQRAIEADPLAQELAESTDSQIASRCKSDIEVISISVNRSKKAG